MPAATTALDASDHPTRSLRADFRPAYRGASPGRSSPPLDPPGCPTAPPRYPARLAWSVTLCTRSVRRRPSGHGSGAQSRSLLGRHRFGHGSGLDSAVPAHSPSRRASWPGSIGTAAAGWPAGPRRRTDRDAPSISSRRHQPGRSIAGPAAPAGSQAPEPAHRTATGDKPRARACEPALSRARHEVVGLRSRSRGLPHTTVPHAPQSAPHVMTGPGRRRQQNVPPPSGRCPIGRRRGAGARGLGAVGEA